MISKIYPVENKNHSDETAIIIKLGASHCFDF